MTNLPTFHLADLWETLVDAGPDAECVVAGEQRHTRRSLDTAANRLGHALATRGVRSGQHVGIYARNRAEYFEGLLGCWKIGARPININWRYVTDELRYVIADAEIVAMIVERTYLPLLDELSGEFPSVHAVLVLEDGSAEAPSTITTESYDAALAASSPERGFGVERTADDVYMLYTGGTTGMPKGVMWRHEDFFYACVMGGNPLGPISTPSEIANNATPVFQMDALVLGPLMHGGGQWLSLIAMYSGNRAIVYTEPSFDAEKVLDLIDRERPLTIGLIGDAMGRPLAETALANPQRWDLTSLASIGNGGAMLSASIKADLRRAFPNAMTRDSFGASETGAAGSESETPTPGAAGPAFVSDGNTTVLDPETLEPLAPGSPEQGMLAKRGYIPLGYWNDPAKTAKTFRTDRHGVRWVIPGDFAMLDEQGRVVLLGRGSGCINSGGEKIFPEEVEAAIRTHPSVFDAVVVGMPDERFGQKVVALVALRDGIGELSLAELQAHCRTKIAGYKVPREVLLGEAPRTNVGKPDYKNAAEIARVRLS